jgi:DNA mismatch endonuclease, patch repair protein
MDSYPAPDSSAVSKRMARNRKRDTKPELAVRSSLHARGLRFRVNYRIKLRDFAVRPDVVFTKRRIAVFIDGCFWHSCPQHGNSPARNQHYWGPKLERNVERDRKVDLALRESAWHVIRAWEHEDVEAVADRVLAAMASTT